MDEAGYLITKGKTTATNFLEFLLLEMFKTKNIARQLLLPVQDVWQP